MATQTCKDCKFYEAKNQNEQNGYCKRYAPAPTPAHYAKGHVADWPQVYKGDWCGDFVAGTVMATSTRYAG